MPSPSEAEEQYHFQAQRSYFLLIKAKELDL